MKRAPLRPATKPMARRSRLPAKNLDRQARLRAEQFGPEAEWMRDLPCCVCERRPPSEPSHVTSRGAGGKRQDQLPMCQMCHRGLHAVGVETFQARRQGLDLAAIAKGCADRWAALDPVHRELYRQLFRQRWSAAARILDQNGGW